MSTELLRGLSLFAGLAEEDLAWLCAQAEPVEVRAGEVLMEAGSASDALYIVLEGRFEVSVPYTGRPVVIAVSGPGDLVGEISFLEQSSRTATVRAVRDARLLKISHAVFERLMSLSPTAAMAVLRTVTVRLRNTELMLRQREKMTAIGGLSAGLAHELNNPAAAIRSSAEHLCGALLALQRSSFTLGSLALTEAQAETVDSLHEELLRRAAAPPHLDPIARGDLEADLESWLAEQGAGDAWALAPPLVDLGWQADDLEGLTTGLSPAQRLAFVAWLAAACTAYSLMSEARRGAEHISVIVKAVRSYTHLDQAPIQLVDVREEIENTLAVLRSRLNGVNVVREYDPDLPRIEAYASELNEVWTTLIDNALDALGGHGEIRIRVRAAGPEIVVEVADNGPGIPPHIQPRIFEAFVSTKEPGTGAGLGLHVTYNIVVHHHKGEISAESRPGETKFTVRLPVRIPPLAPAELEG